MFHALSALCADTFVGGKSADRSNPAWRQVYRALEHGKAYQACKSNKLHQFSKPIEDFGNAFVDLKSAREKADYDPVTTLTRSSVLADIALATSALKKLGSAAAKDKRAFAVFVLLGPQSKGRR